MDADTQQVVRIISAVAAATIGTKNKQNLMMKSMDSVSVTTSSRYYMEKLCLQYSHNPVIKIFLQVLSTHHKTQGDAGWLCITLATQLLSASYKKDIPVYALIRGLNLACQLAVDELSSPSTPVALTLDWGEPSQVVNLLLTLFRPHQPSTNMTDENMESLAKSLLEAFIGSLSDGSNGSLTSHVIFHSSSLTLFLPSDICCQHLEGSILIDIPLPRAFPVHGARDVLVVVFEQSLEFPEQLENISIENHTTAASRGGAKQRDVSVKALEYAYLEEMCEIFVRANIGLVCCQRRIHPHLQRLLSLKGIVCVPRLSIRYVNAVLRLSGAKQLGAFPQIQSLKSSQHATCMPLNVSSFGFLHRIYMRHIGEKSFLVIQQSMVYDNQAAGEGEEEDYEDEEAVLTKLLRDRDVVLEVIARRVKVSTLLLVGMSDGLCREVEYMCTGAVKVLTQLINSSSATVLPGGGCWQAYIAKHVRGKLQLMKDREEKGEQGMVSIAPKRTKEDIGDVDEFLSSVAPPSPFRDITRAAQLFCEALEFAAMLVGGSVDNRIELENFLQSQNGVTLSEALNQHGWGGFSWTTPPHPPPSVPEGFTAPQQSYRFSNGTGCVIWTEARAERKQDIFRADALDGLIPCVSAIQVAIEAVTSVIDIDGIVE